MQVRKCGVEGIGRFSTRKRERVSGSRNSYAGFQASVKRSSFQCKERKGYVRKGNRMRPMLSLIHI